MQQKKGGLSVSLKCLEIFAVTSEWNLEILVKRYKYTFRTTNLDVLIKFIPFINNQRKIDIFKYSVLQEYMLGIWKKIS